MLTRTRAPRRAPALIMNGRAASDDDTKYRFRLPVPPAPSSGAFAAHAVERRAKKIYFAVLDAMRTGTVDPALRGRLSRLIAEARPRADHMLRHLVRVLDAVSRRAKETGGAPLLPLPPAPMAEINVTIAKARDADCSAQTAQEMLRWPLEWLQTRGLALAKSLHIDVSEAARAEAARGDVPEVVQR
jgi:hypothetical protein